MNAQQIDNEIERLQKAKENLLKEGRKNKVMNTTHINHDNKTMLLYVDSTSNLLQDIKKELENKGFSLPLLYLKDESEVITTRYKITIEKIDNKNQ